MMRAPHVSNTMLSGRRVLLIEDEYFQADDMARLLRTLGAEVVGPVGEVEEALDLCQSDEQFDMAVLDINLKNDLIYPVAHELRARAIPFIFMSGYGRKTIPDEYRDIVLVEKPVDDFVMRRALNRLAAAN